MTSLAYRVLDASTGIGGAYCAKVLGDAGAEVCLVEPPGGHPLRRWSMTGSVPAGADGALFRYLHHGHRSVCVPGPEPEGPGVDVDLALAAADIAIADGTSLIGEPESLAAANPGLVVACITPFGLAGPYTQRPANEFIAQAEGGAIAVRGARDRPPYQLGGRVTEWVSGAYAAVAALASAGRAAAHGHGDLIDVSMCEVANLSGTTYANLFHSLLGHPPVDPRSPARTIETPSIEPTADGWVGFNTNTREQFEAFCILIERPELIESEEFTMLADRVRRHAEWTELVRTWTTKHPTAEIVERAAELRIPVAPVGTPPDVLELEQATSRGCFVDDPTGTMRVPRRPWRIDDEPVPPLRRAPVVGAHGAAPFSDDRRHRATPEPLSAQAPPLPLEGLKVADFTTWWAGPSATALLAALGAEVIHVESTRHLDGARMVGGVVHQGDGWWEYSSFFFHANANKRDLTLDLATERGRQLALELAGWADVVFENFTPRVLDGFDLGFDAFHRANPQVVMVRMPAFGLDGPWRDRPGFAQTMEQATGLAWMTGHADDQPCIQRGPCDPNGGLHAIVGMLAGLARRARTGDGCLVEAAMFDAALAVAAEPVLEWTAYGMRVGRDGNRSPAAVPQGLYLGAAPESWLAVSCQTDGQWAALVDAVGDDRLRDPGLGDRRARRDRHDEIDAVLAAWSAARPVGDAVATLVAAGVPAGVAVDPRTVHTHPQLVARGYFELVDHPVAGRHLTPSVPWRSRGIDRWLRAPAETLGASNEHVLGDLLGHSAGEIADLEETGITGIRPAGV